jgi:signal transduction histidine kinase
VGEEAAVEVMRAGASDFVMKGNLGRLPLIIERELKEAQSRAQRAKVNAQFQTLVEASKVLFSSLDYKQTLLSAAKLVLPHFADWVVFDIVNKDGAITRFTVEHADPALREVAEELKKYSPKKEFSSVSWDAIETGRLRFEKVITPAFIDRQIQSTEHRKLLLTLGLKSLISVPLESHGRTLGAVTLVLGHSGRTFSDDDIPFARELASRASIAVDNAQLYANLQCALLTRDEFMSIASHELKTPLTSLRLQIQMRKRFLRRGELEAFTLDKLEKMFDGDERQVMRLTHLIDDMLDLTRINTGRLSISPEECDLSQLVREVVDRHSAHLTQAGCSLVLNANAAINGKWDRFRIEQVVTNLITNAAKYAPHAPVEISTQGTSSFAEIRVKDHGNGIHPEDHGRIFNRFERAVGKNGASGFGLGLYITRQIVELHGGTIRVESEPGAGAMFIVELPYASKARELFDAPVAIL